MKKPYDSATFKVADGITGKISVSKKGRLYLELMTDAPHEHNVFMAVKENSRLYVRPQGTLGQGPLLDMVLVATPDHRAVIVRSWSSGLVTVEAEGSWALTWNNLLRVKGKAPVQHYALLNVA